MKILDIFFVFAIVLKANGVDLGYNSNYMYNCRADYTVQ